jgi:hypothetical protein
MFVANERWQTQTENNILDHLKKYEVLAESSLSIHFTGSMIVN